MNMYIDDIAANRNLSGEDLRVFLVLLSRLKDDSFEVQLSQAQIAQKLGKNRQNTSRAINKLVQEKIIRKHYLGNKLIGYKILVQA